MGIHTDEFREYFKIGDEIIVLYGFMPSENEIIQGKLSNISEDNLIVDKTKKLKWSFINFVTKVEDGFPMDRLIDKDGNVRTLGTKQILELNNGLEFSDGWFG